ncbi:MAG: flagellar motor protein MotB [Henriciella sp.]|uniref:OmpA family protein n=1 Tax=Henriciella sp. TaxID=1968823 RepID=UPI003C768FD8
MAANYASHVRATRTPQSPVRSRGAWKLAYADFLTALCAFFLVMWLIHGASTEQRSDIAVQFSAPKHNSPALLNSSDAQTAQIAEALSQSDLLAAHASNIIMQVDDGFVRLELVDLDRAPLFNSGEETLNQHGQDLIELTAVAVKPLGLSLSIEGHTDSAPIDRPDYSNWELSSGRANAARRALIGNGVSESRILSVSGLADTRPLQPGEGGLPQNRRLSIVLHTK